MVYKVNVCTPIANEAAGRAGRCVHILAMCALAIHAVTE